MSMTTGVILDGYDPVAFFTDNKPIKGDPTFNFQYKALRIICFPGTP